MIEVRAGQGHGGGPMPIAENYPPLAHTDR